jgi:hypothetical protein
VAQRRLAGEGIGLWHLDLSVSGDGAPVDGPEASPHAEAR